MRILWPFFMVIWVAGCSHASVAGDDFSKEEVRATPITSSLYFLEGAGGNMTALIGSGGTLLVDDDLEPMAGKILGKLRELGGDIPRFIVNTHFHYDHTGGNLDFGSNATIIAASAVRERLMTEQTLWKKQHPAMPLRAWPSLTFDHALSLHFNGEDPEIVHFPSAHTDGDTVVFFPHNRAVSMGDLYFAGMYPIFHPEHQGSLSGYIRAIESVLRRIPEDARIIPGHGPMTSKSELRRYYRMVLASVATVRKGIQNHRSLEQIQRDGLPVEWESFSHGYSTTDRWIESVYRGLVR